MTAAATPEQTANSAGLELSDAEFASLSQMIHRETGIVMAPSKRALLQSRLYKRLRFHGLDSFGAYCALLESGDGQFERREMISAITTNVTRFLREPHHFRELREEVLPPLLERAQNGRRLRIWSAGCSTGEEPYSLAFTLLDLLPEATRHDIRILATDLDPNVIRKAETGRYPTASLAPLSPQARQDHFRPAGDGFSEVRDRARRLVTFRVLNLLDDWPFRGDFDVIFCRNVVIYFDDATQRRLWTRFAGVQTRPGARLFIGHSERLSDEARPYYRLDRGASYVRTDRHVPQHDTQPARAGADRSA